MEIVVNGAKQMVTENTTVSQLLTTLNIPAERVVVELNLTILKHTQHPSMVLKQGDQVEIVHFVGGGSDRRQPVGFRHQTEACDLWSVV